MLYYDRRIEAGLLSLLTEGAPLSWLVAHTRADTQTRLEFRRADGERRRGSIQLYRGRTSPLEVIGLANGQVKLKAHSTYRALAPRLFGSPRMPGGLEDSLVPYLKHVQGTTPDAFTDGEGRVHNELMRRYSLLYTNGDPVLLLDSEVCVGFRKDPHHRTGSTHRLAHQLQMERDLCLPAGQRHTKLDALGLLPSGELALVEVKNANGNIAEAAQQLAAHLYMFSALLRQGEPSLVAAVDGLVSQKVTSGLIPSSPLLPRLTPTQLVAVIAAPDAREDWCLHWRAAIGKTLSRVPAIPYRVELWRLQPSGNIAERQSL